MSAKQFYKKPFIRLPELPPEIWGLILRHATLIPEGIELDFSAQQIGFRGPTVAREQFKSLKISLVTKRSIVRVNKTWQKLAVPFLYEYVALVRSKSLLSLIDALERYEAEEGMLGLGWWTHRLDVNLRDYLETPEDTEQAVARIITHMPNLRIITFSNTQTMIRGYEVTWSPFVLKALDCCRETLESIHFYMPPGPSCQDWTMFLEHHPSIRSINGNYPISRDSHITLDKLTTMHVSSYCFETGAYYPWHLDLPSLRAITYGLSASGSTSLANKDFFQRVGPQLTLLQVSFIQAAWYAPTTLANTLRLVFTDVLETCHNLEQVNFAFHSWGSLSLYTPVLPLKVHKLGIRIVAPQISKSMTLALFTSSLRTIARLNPGLKTIQFLSKRNVQALHHCHCQLFEGLRVFRETGVNICDDEGTSM